MSHNGHEGSYDQQRLRLTAETTAGLQSLARRQKLTLNTLIQGAWAMLLSRYSGSDDIVFGTAVSGRPPELAAEPAKGQPGRRAA